jgi:hypothetical protein
MVPACGTKLVRHGSEAPASYDPIRTGGRIDDVLLRADVCLPRQDDPKDRRASKFSSDHIVERRATVVGDDVEGARILAPEVHRERRAAVVSGASSTGKNVSQLTENALDVVRGVIRGARRRFDLDDRVLPRLRRWAWNGIASDVDGGHSLNFP